MSSGVPGGSPVVAARDGYISQASDAGDGYGNAVVVNHTDNYQTRYGHFSSIANNPNTGLRWAVNDFVRRGQVLGVEGNTGAALGVHLHFEINVNGHPAGTLADMYDWDNYLQFGPLPVTTNVGTAVLTNFAPLKSTDSAGIYRAGTWYLADDSRSGMPTAFQTPFNFGDGAHKPVPGDGNGDGVDAAQVEAPFTAPPVWYIEGSPPFHWGWSPCKMLVGDWDGNKTMTPGMYCDGYWYITNTTVDNSSWTFKCYFGDPTDQPVVGDWVRSGHSQLGLFRNGVWYLDGNDDCVSTPTLGDIYGFSYGNASGDIAVTGDWNGDGYDTIGIYRNGYWFLKNGYGNSYTDYFFFHGGQAGDIPIAGDWNGL